MRYGRWWTPLVPGIGLCVSGASRTRAKGERRARDLAKTYRHVELLRTVRRGDPGVVVVTFKDGIRQPRGAR